MAETVAKGLADAPLPHKVALFVAEYQKDHNGAQAAIRAGYAPKASKVTASRLLARANVKAAIANQTAERVAQVAFETGITLERTLRELARIAYFDPRKLFDKSGRPLAITELNDDTAAVVAGLDVLEEFEGSGAYRILIGHVKKWKIADKKGALDMLMKHLGGYAEDNVQKTPTTTAPVSTTEAVRTIAFAMQIGYQNSQKAKAAANDPSSPARQALP